MRALVILAGLVIGVALTLFLLIRDPLGLFEAASVEPLKDPTQLVVNTSIQRGIIASPAGLLGSEEAQIAPFADSALRHARLEVALLDSTDGGARALAVKLSATDGDNSLLQGRLAADSAWNLMWPGHGSLFLIGRDDFRPPLGDYLVSTLAGTELANSQPLQPISISPRLLGAGGRLTLAEGTYREYWAPDARSELELSLAED
jgi:hypothetical protein